MNVIDRYNIKKSICATCLSRDRKLYLFYEVKSQMTFPTHLELGLSDYEDMLCWECKAQLLKMSNFRARAATAQAILQTLERGQTITSLRCLTTMKSTHLPPQIITVQHSNNGTNYDFEQKPNPNILFVNDNTELKEENEIKVELDANLDEIQTDNTIFATELDILQNIDNNKNIKDERAHAIEKRDQKNIQQTRKRKKKPSQQSMKKVKSSENNEVDINEPCTSKVTKQKLDSGEEMSYKQVRKKTRQQICEESDEIVNEDFDNGSDFDYTDTDYEFTVPNEVTPASQLTIGDTYKIKYGVQTKDVYTITTVSHEELLDIRAKRLKSKKFINCKWKCDSCVLSFRSAKSMQEHVVLHKHTGKFVCDVCEVAFRAQDDLTQHRQTHYRFYKCCSCKFGSLSLDFTMDHYESHHETKIKTCEDCKTDFMSHYDYKVHRRSVHGKKPECDQCGKKLFSKLSLDRHMLLHGEVPMVECPICHNKYRGEWAVQSHIKRIHDRDNSKKDESAYCAECDKYFSCLLSYKSHIKTALVHNNSGKDFKNQCKHCQKRFGSAWYLQQHIAAMHSDSLDYPCDICKQRFKTRKRMRIHVRQKHEGYVLPKNKVCEICAKAFTSKKMLEEHMNSHTGARPYVCTTCGATFGYASALYTHNRLRHKVGKIRDREQTLHN